MFAKKQLEQADHLVDQAGPMLRHATDRVTELAHQGVESVVETSIRLRDNAVRAADGTVKYIKREPVKATLIAAGVGAGLMALATMISRSRNRH
jgi:ElaB/YqjD/DUF883 family membrane-anchored ribosome-binding protein